MNSPSAFLIGHVFDPATRVYMMPVRLFAAADGSVALPDNVTRIAPTQQPGRYENLRLNKASTAWEIVPDLRHFMLWDTTTARPVANTLKLGQPLPAGMTLKEPPPADGSAQAPQWDAVTQHWRLIPDYSGRPLWHTTDGRLALPVPRGTSLPPGVTDCSPPPQRRGPIRFDELTSTWVEVPERAPNDELLSHDPAPNASAD